MILVIALVGCMGAAPATPAPAENPVLGKWRWSAKDGSCHELH
jgi:hypothetical protein